MEGNEEDDTAEYEALLASGEKIARSVTRIPEDVKELRAYGASEVFLERQKHPDRLTTRDERQRFMNKVIHRKDMNAGRDDRAARKNEGEMIRRMKANESPIGQPDKEFDAKVLAGELGEALAELTPKYRRIMTMLFYEGYTKEEIADATGVSVEVLRVQIRRALGRMKRNENLAAYYKLWVTE
jgi:RNA polymerase sigma factor (sigma-70 family)